MDERVFCRHCGVRRGGHRCTDGRCPRTRAWGEACPFPMSDRSLDGEALDAALLAFWGTDTTFRPAT